MAPFATLNELKGRLEWTLDTAEERAATGALEDLSEWARYYGRNWEVNASPRLVKTLVLGAAARFMRNPDSYTLSRAGDESLGWTDRGAESGTATFTKNEIEALRMLVRPVAFGTAAMTAWGPMRTVAPDGMVPVAGGGDKFPLFSDDTPW
jgi:hypothetical protein